MHDIERDYRAKCQLFEQCVDQPGPEADELGEEIAELAKLMATDAALKGTCAQLAHTSGGAIGGFACIEMIEAAQPDSPQQRAWIQRLVVIGSEATSVSQLFTCYLDVKGLRPPQA
jgi:hypothetical protein